MKLNSVLRKASRDNPEGFRALVKQVQDDCRYACIDESNIAEIVYKICTDEDPVISQDINLFAARAEAILLTGGVTGFLAAPYIVLFNGPFYNPYIGGTAGAVASIICAAPISLTSLVGGVLLSDYVGQKIKNHFSSLPRYEEIARVAAQNRERTKNPEKFDREWEEEQKDRHSRINAMPWFARPLSRGLAKLLRLDKKPEL
ncbi:MAG: hypothetical protein AABY02_01105 [Nanoarchaeota archaeon]